MGSIERGKRNLSLLVMTVIADALSVSLVNRLAGQVLRVWHRRMCIGLPNRLGEIVTRGPLQFAPSPR
jgi:hypothetical protein